MAYIIVAGGEIRDYDFFFSYINNEKNKIICADGGLQHMKKWGVKPHIIMGDFDSCPSYIMDQYKDCEIKAFPPEKDQTDFEIAIVEAIQRGAEEIMVFGATGGRLDHTLGNIHCLMKALEVKVPACIIDEYNRVQLVNSKTMFKNKEGHYISLIPLTSKVEGITLTGFKYPLLNATIEYGTSLGISNEFIDGEGRIELEKGVLIVVQAKDRQVI